MIRLGTRMVGPGEPCEPCLIVAELGLNHNGSLGRALDMVQAAKEAGADAVKVQSFGASCFTTARATWQGESQLEMFRRYELPRHAYIEIAEKTRRAGMMFFGTPDCAQHAEWLLDAGAPCLKVGSDDLTNLPLLRQLAKYGVPLILSTGMAGQREIDLALDAVQDVPILALYCCSIYPARLDQLRLRQVYGLGGFSDHTVGPVAAAVAVAFGAGMIEKHFTLSHDLPGPDHRWSADPQEFAELVATVRGVEAALTTAPMDPSEVAMQAVARRSIVAARAISNGHLLEDADVALKRPGDGLPPAMLGEVLGRRTVRAIEADERIWLEDLK